MAPSALLITLALAVCAIAAPQFPPPPPGTGTPSNGLLTCPISSTLVLPSNQTALATPNSTASFVTLGVGFQNYTCSSAGNYTSVGAIVDVYDLSCLSKVPALFNYIQDVAYVAWEVAPAGVNQNVGHDVGGYPLLGAHFFINSTSGTDISPVWDFRGASAKGNPDAFTLDAVVATLPAPTGSQDIDWVQLQSVSGALATQVYRTDTRGGVPPASCEVGSGPITVKFTCKYWMYGGTVKV